MPAKSLLAFGGVLCLCLIGQPEAAQCAAADHAGAKEIGFPFAPQTTESLATTTTTPLVLTLQEALQRTLERNQQIQAAAHETEALASEVRQAGVRPNPELSIELENLWGTDASEGLSQAESTATISQRIELGDKREQRQNVSLGRLESGERELERVRNDLIFATTERFIALQAAQEKLTLAEEQAGLAETVLHSVESRINAGKTPDIERLRFQALLTTARLRQTNAEQNLAARRSVLAASWGADEIDFATVKGNFDQIPGIPSWQELIALIDASPATASAEAAVQTADRSLALEQANQTPDLTISLGLRNNQETDENTLVAGISMPLPIFDRNKAGVKAAHARLAKARAQKNAEQVRLREALVEGWQRLNTAHNEIVVLRQQILPAAEKSFAAMSYGYSSGKFGFLEVLDAEQSLFEAKNRYIDALTDFRIALAELERLLGKQLGTASIGAEATDKQRGQS